MSMGEARNGSAGALTDEHAQTGDIRLKERLRGMAATKSSVVHNGRFFYYSELNALTYWYEDHTHSTRMVYVEAEG